MSSIPKIVHYVWLGGGEKPKTFYKCLESIKKFCPDWQIMEWNESNFDFSSNQYAMQAYALKKYGFVADYIRAKVLCDFGGLYIDTDVELVKNFNDLQNNDMVLSFENNVYISTATMLSSKNHPFFELICKYYQNRPFLSAKGNPDYTPNTISWTYFLKKYYGLKTSGKMQTLESSIYGKKSNILLLPQDYFSPLNCTTRKLKITKNTYSIHYFNASWFTKTLKFGAVMSKIAYYVFTPFLYTQLTKLSTISY